MFFPSPEHARTAFGAVLGAFGGPERLHDVQRAVLEDLGAALYGIDLGIAVIEPLSAARFLELEPSIAGREQVIRLCTIIELLDDALSTDEARRVDRYAGDIGVRDRFSSEARAIAEHRAVLLHADLLRHSWYTEKTVQESLRGRLGELIRSKLSYLGITSDQELAGRWRALRDLPEGTWGRGVADFYDRHGFPFPGEPHGIYEIGAHHDFVHVLADYEATAEGELDTFALIAATMDGDAGLSLLAVTLGMFQNGAIRHMLGKHIEIARSSTLSDPGASRRWAAAFRRGAACRYDLLGGIDHFALAPLPLEEARTRIGLPPAQR